MQLKDCTSQGNGIRNSKNENKRTKDFCCVSEPTEIWQKIRWINEKNEQFLTNRFLLAKMQRMINSKKNPDCFLIITFELWNLILKTVLTLWLKCEIESIDTGALFHCQFYRDHQDCQRIVQTFHETPGNACKSK